LEDRFPAALSNKSTIGLAEAANWAFAYDAAPAAPSMFSHFPSKASPKESNQSDTVSAIEVNPPKTAVPNASSNATTNGLPEVNPVNNAPSRPELPHGVVVVFVIDVCHSSSVVAA
jgi:hypothetical protein